jgi:hypothetical protein
VQKCESRHRITSTSTAIAGKGAGERERGEGGGAPLLQLLPGRVPTVAVLCGKKGFLLRTIPHVEAVQHDPHQQQTDRRATPYEGKQEGKNVKEVRRSEGQKVKS